MVAVTDYINRLMNRKRIVGVMVNVLGSSAVDRVSGQHQD